MAQNLRSGCTKVEDETHLSLIKAYASQEVSPQVIRQQLTDATDHPIYTLDAITTALRQVRAYKPTGLDNEAEGKVTPDKPEISSPGFNGDAQDASAPQLQINFQGTPFPCKFYVNARSFQEIRAAVTKKLVALKWDSFDGLGVLFFVPDRSDLPIPVTDDEAWLSVWPEY